MTARTFWSNAGIILPGNWYATDPRIYYDPTVQRWFASSGDFDGTGIISTNHFLLAISASADPTGSWKGVSFLADPGGTNFADFPTLGLDANGVYLAGDMWDAGGASLNATLLVSIPKADLLAATPIITNRTSFGIMSYANRGDILQPVVCLDGSSGGNVLATGSLGFDPVTGNLETNSTLAGSTVLNSAGPGGATLSSPTIISVPPYTAPLNPPQPDGTSNLNDGDSRFSATIYAVGGVLYAVHGTQAGSRAAIRWYRINAANHALLESGTITDTNLDLFYPSIAANTNGTVVIGCNGCNTNTFISCYAFVGETVNGTTAFGNQILLKSGAASYHDFQERTNNPINPSRWGDYSSTCVDPAGPNRFWTIQMYPSGADTWSTQITELRTGVQLSVALAGTNITIAWPETAVAFNLESNTNLSTTNWTVVPQNLSTNAGQVSVLAPLAGRAKFFRLHKP